MFIGSGSVTALASSTNAAGTSLVTNYNDGNYTKISISGTTANLTGFTVTLSNIQGYMLSDDGANELNATTLKLSIPMEQVLLFTPIFLATLKLLEEGLVTLL